MFCYILHVAFSFFSILLFVRVFSSWFPSFQGMRWMQALGFITDPYLTLFRRIIPSLGMIDLSPMVAFFSLQILEKLVLAIFR